MFEVNLIMKKQLHRSKLKDTLQKTGLAFSKCH